MDSLPFPELDASLKEGGLMWPMPSKEKKKQKATMMMTTMAPNRTQRRLVVATVLLLAHISSAFNDFLCLPQAAPSRVHKRRVSFSAAPPTVRQSEDLLQAQPTTHPSPSVASLVQDATTVDLLLEAAQGLVPPGEEGFHWQHQPHHQRKRQLVSARLLSKLAKLAVGLDNEPARRRIAASPALQRCLRSLDIVCDTAVSSSESSSSSKNTDDEAQSGVGVSTATETSMLDSRCKHDDAASLRNALYALAVLIPTTTLSFKPSPQSPSSSAVLVLEGGVAAMRAKATDLAARLSLSFETATTSRIDPKATMTPEEHEVLWACRRLGIDEPVGSGRSRTSGVPSAANANIGRAPSHALLRPARVNGGNSGGGSGGGVGYDVGGHGSGPASVSGTVSGGGGLPFHVLCSHALSHDTPRPMTAAAAAGLSSASTPLPLVSASATPWTLPPAEAVDNGIAGDDGVDGIAGDVAVYGTGGDNGCHVSLSELEAQVPFKEEVLVTKSGKEVKERRATCWMGDAGMGGFAYSGKIMPAVPWSPCVERLRDALEEKWGVRYDCALLNWYGAGGESACAWHADPEVGSYWQADSMIVSVGETRRFAFREKLSTDKTKGVTKGVTKGATKSMAKGATKGMAKSGAATRSPQTYQFHVFDGCCIRMFGDCQDAYEHCVFPAEGGVPNGGASGGGNMGARASIVFKTSILTSAGRRGHGTRTPAAAASAAISVSAASEPRNKAAVQPRKPHKRKGGDMGKRGERGK